MDKEPETSAEVLLLELKGHQVVKVVMVPLTVVSIVETLVVARVIPTVKALTFNDALGDFATELKLLEFLAYWLDEFPHPLVDTIVLYSVTA